MLRPPAVLGLRLGGRDPAVSLLLGGTVVGSERAARVADGAAEARPSGFPTESVRRCLSAAGLSAEDLDHVAYVDELPEVGRSHAGQGLPEVFAQHLELAPDTLRACFHRVDERRARLSYAFYSSPWDAAAVAAVGGYGDPSAAVWGSAFDTALALGGRVAREHSPALLTAALTQHLGIADEPGALDALARRARSADGIGSAGQERADALVRFESRGRFGWIVGPTSIDDRGPWSDWMTNSFGPARSPCAPLEDRHFQAAAALSGALERVVLHVLHHLAVETGLDRLCLTGGAASSPRLVDRIRAATPFRAVFTPPGSADAGIAAGAALDLWHRGLALPRSVPIDSEARAAEPARPGVPPRFASWIGAAG